MSRRGDNIHKRSDGRWEGRYISGRSDNGKALYRSVYAYSYAECAHKLKLARCDLLPVNKPMTLSELFSAWLINRKNKVKQSTFVNYKNLFDSYLREQLGARRVDGLNAFMLNTYIDGLLTSGGKNSQGLSAVTVQAVIIVLRSVLEYGEQEFGLPDPAKHLTMPKTETAEITLFDAAEMRRIRCAGLTGNGYELGVVLSLYTGMRIGELCALTWGDIDLTEKTINVKKTLFRIKNPYADEPKTIVITDTPKSKFSIRAVPVPTFMLTALSELKCSQPESNYFLTCSPSHTEPRSYSSKYKSFLNSLDIPYRRFHSLRHTFATECVKSGVDVKSLSELLGHSSVKITLERYVHSDMELKRKELEKLYSNV